jgi:site-specific DNA recombinase
MNGPRPSPNLGLDDSPAALRAVLYMRVSTGRQAEHDLSIPDQRSQLKSWCRANGHDIVAEYIEAGASAGDDRRAAFQQMIERACDGERAFDIIVVHSYSRFFREAFEQEFYLRKLAKHGVRVVSITQPVGDETEPVHAMMRKVIALFDEYQSKENAKHVIRSMKENARQGFWNGATPPLGYRVIEAENRGAKIKKKLEVDPVEAETVRLIFKLYLLGDGNSGALGVKEIVKWLNARGYRTRRGNTFGVGQLHKLLTNTVYIGRWKFNQASSKTRKKKADEEVVEIPVPAIIEPDTFEQVQRQLHARSPKRQAPRVTTGPILLTGLAVCATCRGGMMLRTGTSKGGRVYRYYTCSNCATKGKTACKGRSIPMDKLDRMVTDHLLERLFKPERIALILGSLTDERRDDEPSRAPGKGRRAVARDDRLHPPAADGAGGGGLTGAASARRTRTWPSATATAAGCGDRRAETVELRIPKLRKGSYFPGFWSRVGWLRRRLRQWSRRPTCMAYRRARRESEILSCGTLRKLFPTFE